MQSTEDGFGGEITPAAAPKAAKRRKKSPPHKAPTPAWVVLFANLMALLMTFFIMLVTFSTVQEDNVKLVLASLAGAGLLSGGFGVKFEDAATQPLPGRPVRTISGGKQAWNVGEPPVELYCVSREPSSSGPGRRLFSRPRMACWTKWPRSSRR